MLKKQIQNNEVHLWYTSLPVFEKRFSEFQKIISNEELLRAKRFVKQSDQIKFILCKAIQRKILAQYLEIKPEEIQFHFNEHGKPFIPNSAVQFNLSHSGDCLLIGVTLHQYIGVDVECVRKNQDYLALAKRFFTPSEYAAIKNPDDFYRCWTRKEAFIKATGLGLSFGLSNFEVAVSELSPGQSALINMHNDQIAAKTWFLRSVLLERLPQKYFAAIAVQGEVQRILYPDFSSDFC